MRLRLGVALAVGGVAESLAGLGHSGWRELHDKLPHGVTWDGVQVVEVDDAVARNSVVCGGQLEF